MVFNSIEYLIFLPIVFALYWLLRQAQHRTVLILVASYIFYGWWDPKFLLLIAFSSLVDYYTALRIYNAPEKQHKKYWLWLSLAINLGMLGVFKYYNFFVGNLELALQSIGLEWNFYTLRIILPVGISFYTFQTLSYSLDVYQGKMKPTRNILNFFAYVSFFPQLVAGPIERARRLLPQFDHVKTFDYNLAVDGCRQILWGLFKKIAIADYVAQRVDFAYANYEYVSTADLWLSAVLFNLQLYADFSGYTDVALGTAKLFGYRLSVNFNNPLHSVSIPDFWARWHITMTNWFRDYVFVPIALRNKKSQWWQFFSTMVLLLVIGIWHGANWTFIIFGFIHGLYFIPRILSKNYEWLRKLIANLKKGYWMWVSILFITLVNGMTAIFFRSMTIQDAFGYFVRLWDFSGDKPLYQDYTGSYFLFAWLFIQDWVFRNEEHRFKVDRFPLWVRALWYYVLLALILIFGNFGERPFIYFQF